MSVGEFQMCLLRDVSLLAWVSLFAFPLLGISQELFSKQENKRRVLIKTWFLRRINLYLQPQVYADTALKTVLLHVVVWIHPILMLVIISETWLHACQYFSLHVSMALLFIGGFFNLLIGIFVAKGLAIYYNLRHFYVRQSVVIVIWAVALGVLKDTNESSFNIIIIPLFLTAAAIALVVRQQLWFDTFNPRFDRVVLPLTSQLSGPTLIAFDAGRSLEFIAMYLIVVRLFLLQLNISLIHLSIGFMIICFLQSMFSYAWQKQMHEEMLLKVLWIYLSPLILLGHFLSSSLLHYFMF